MTLLTRWQEDLTLHLPVMVEVTAITQQDINSSVHVGLLHLVLVTLDAMLNLIRHPVPYVTISTRCARAIMTAQHTGHAAPWFALLTGLFLELVNPGHLNAAMRGDAARYVFGLMYVAPGLAPKVT